MTVDEMELGRVLVQRCAAVGLVVWQDPVTGELQLPHTELLPSLLVSLETIKKLSIQVRDLEDEVSDLKGFVYLGESTGV